MMPAKFKIAVVLVGLCVWGVACGATPLFGPTSVAMYVGDTLVHHGHYLTAGPLEKSPVQDGKYKVVLPITVGNLTGDTFMPIDEVRLLDTEGFTYEGYGSLPVLELENGERLQGVLEFELNEEVQPASLKLERLLPNTNLVITLTAPPPDYQMLTNDVTRKPRANLAPLGETVSDKGFNLAINKINDPPAPEDLEYLTPEDWPGQRLVALEVIVDNKAGRDISHSSSAWYLVDDTGTLYEPWDYGSLKGKDLTDLEVKDGDKVKGWLLFLLPETVEPESLRFDYQTYGRNAIKVRLYLGLSE